MLHQRFPDIAARTRGNYRWTELQDETLRQLFVAMESGESMAARINEAFGTSYSPNAVQCRAHVIGLRRAGKRPAVEWTDAMNATLRDGIENRMTYTQISAGMSISTGAIGDQARRLGIKVPRGFRRSPEEQAASRERIERRDEARKREKRLHRLLNFVPREWRESAPLPVSAPAVSDPLNLSLMEVSRMQCHWITNDDMTAPLYCGHPVGHGSWCERHWRVVKRPTSKMDEKRIAFLAKTDEYRAERLGIPEFGINAG